MNRKDTRPLTSVEVLNRMSLTVSHARGYTDDAVIEACSPVVFPDMDERNTFVVTKDS